MRTRARALRWRSVWKTSWAHGIAPEIAHEDDGDVAVVENENHEEPAARIDLTIHRSEGEE
jgi:hypothetical protein